MADAGTMPSPRRDALDPGAMTSRLSSAGILGRCRVLGVELLREEPERRRAVAYTIEGSWGRRRLVGYFAGDHASRDLGSMKQLARALESPEFRVAEPIGYLNELQMLLMEFVEGDSLARQLYEGLSEAPAGRMALALARLHACEVTVGRTWGVANELRRTSRWESGLVQTEARARFRVLLDRLKSMATRLEDHPVVTVHGRLTPERFRDERGRTVLFFSDRLRRADPALDLGHFCAFLVVRSIQFPRSRRGCQWARSLFPARYTELRGSAVEPKLARRRLFYEASTLLRLAGVYGTRERWMKLLPGRLLEEVASLLEQGDAR